MGDHHNYPLSPATSHFFAYGQASSAPAPLSSASSYFPPASPRKPPQPPPQAVQALTQLRHVSSIPTARRPPAPPPRPPPSVRCATFPAQISAYPAAFRPVFPYPCFNRLQAVVHNVAANSDLNVVVSAPTGSGKTAVFEMALVRLLAGSPPKGNER